MKNLITSLWVAILPFLSQVSIASDWITLSSADVSSIQTSVFNWGWSFFDMVIQLAPVFIWIFVLFLIMRFIFHKLW